MTNSSRVSRAIEGAEPVEDPDLVLVRAGLLGLRVAVDHHLHEMALREDLGHDHPDDGAPEEDD